MICEAIDGVGVTDAVTMSIPQEGCPACAVGLCWYPANGRHVRVRL